MTVFPICTGAGAEDHALVFVENENATMLYWCVAAK